MKKLIIIIVAAVLVVGGVFAAIFLFDSDMFETTDDIEAIKAAGNYEQMKADIIEVFSLRDTQGVTFADTMFEKVGIKNYEGYEKGGTHGNYTVFADGYELECFIQGGTVGTIYIGNVNIYKDAKVTVAATATTLEYTYSCIGI